MLSYSNSFKSLIENLAAVKMEKEIEVLYTRLSDACKIINQQNLFLESLKSKERVQNLIITDIKEDEDNLGRTEGEKMKLILQVAGYAGTLSLVHGS